MGETMRVVKLPEAVVSLIIQYKGQVADDGMVFNYQTVYFHSDNDRTESGSVVIRRNEDDSLYIFSVNTPCSETWSNIRVNDFRASRQICNSLDYKAEVLNRMSGFISAFQSLKPSLLMMKERE